MVDDKCMDFEKKFVYHTAPVLLGIKPAGLFSVKAGEYDAQKSKYFNSRVRCKGFKLKTLCKCNDRQLMLLYHEESLLRQLSDTANAELLRRFGYNDELTLAEMLEKLSENIKENCTFPHEIGIFLGYPIEDVRGFIENKGENFKLCGYWKVYGDVEKAQKTFNSYNKCRAYLNEKLNQGTNIYQILKIS